MGSLLTGQRYKLIENLTLLVMQILHEIGPLKSCISSPKLPQLCFYLNSKVLCDSRQLNYDLSDTLTPARGLHGRSAGPCPRGREPDV